MQYYGTAEVARLTEIPERAIRSMVRAGYVSPARSTRSALRFSFQDLVLLRTARELLAARIPPRRIGAALRAVRAQLPEDVPARGITVTAAGDRVVVHEGGSRRDAHTGQLLLALEVRSEGGKPRFIDAAAAPPAAAQAGECEVMFEAALQLEDTDVASAVAAYRDCVTKHAHQGALANLGRLLHLQGYLDEAVEMYRGAQQPDANILYNLAVALEDLGKTPDALAAYEKVIALDATHGDAHHNMARLYRETGDERRALRHWNAYRRLARGAQQRE